MIPRAAITCFQSVLKLLFGAHRCCGRFTLWCLFVYSSQEQVCYPGDGGGRKRRLGFPTGKIKKLWFHLLVLQKVVVLFDCFRHFDTCKHMLRSM